MNQLDDLLFTLDICKRALPGDAHPVHYERLREIERILREHSEQQQRIRDLSNRAEYWQLEATRARAKQVQKKGC